VVGGSLNAGRQMNGRGEICVGQINMPSKFSIKIINTEKRKSWFNVLKRRVISPPEYNEMQRENFCGGRY
jgi:hypothetical protein